MRGRLAGQDLYCVVVLIEVKRQENRIKLHNIPSKTSMKEKIDRFSSERQTNSVSG
jgi:hypothetical protein